MAARRPVRRRGDARDPAPAVRAVLHQGAARHGDARLRRAVHPPAQPGHGPDGRLGDEQVARQPGAAVRRAGRARRRRDPADDGLRRAAGGRHRLGRRLAGRVQASSWPGPGGCPATSPAPPGADPATGDVALRRITHRTRRTTRAHAVETLPVQRGRRHGRWSWSTPPARRSTRVPGRPTRRSARRPRPSRSCCRLVAPYTAEEMWARLGHEPTRRPGRLARGRPGAAGRRTSVTCVVQVAGKVRDRLEVRARHRRGRAARAGAGDARGGGGARRPRRRAR